MVLYTYNSNRLKKKTVSKNVDTFRRKTSVYTLKTIVPCTYKYYPFTIVKILDILQAPNLL